eukprot:CAMPEP_0196579076 /NCGR_PEP_ID=MMETSP1081-20130531/17621_1 /TAXON_ID=36882 /ORGANISM="Pyramimonas amylifera, Strain CCMP720" /LENGTH=146 /DNA_ID=CAMNT_0041898527 /DNA_START=333 /DNA_END=773 /DNA_ORIENTATION=+
MPTKVQYMTIHKSTGVLLMGAIIGRVALRLIAGRAGVPVLPPGGVLQHLAANASHTALYGFMLAMPTSGIAMGYYGGKGIPFFGYTIPGADKENRSGWVAKNAFQAHKLMGQAFEYLVPLHIGAVGVHLFKGQNILARLHPFAKSV